MTGKQLFDKFQEEGRKADPDSKAREYAETLTTAYIAVGDKLYPALERAEKEGKKIEVTYPIPIDEGYSEPDGIKLI